VESSADITSKHAHYLGRFVFFVMFLHDKPPFPTHNDRTRLRPFLLTQKE